MLSVYAFRELICISLIIEAYSWNHYEYNEYYMYSDSDGYYDRTENYDDVEAHNGYNPCYFSKSFNFMENPAEVSDSEGNDAEEGGLEGSELEDNHDERNQILGKRLHAPDNNSESAANKRQNTEAANPEELLQDNYDSMNHADIIQLDVTIELGGAMNNHYQYK